MCTRGKRETAAVATIVEAPPNMYDFGVFKSQGGGAATISTPTVTTRNTQREKERMRRVVARIGSSIDFWETTNSNHRRPYVLMLTLEIGFVWFGRTSCASTTISLFLSVCLFVCLFCLSGVRSNCNTAILQIRHIFFENSVMPCIHDGT